MTVFTVTEAVKAREYDTQYGQRVAYKLTVQNGSAQPVKVELSQKPETPPPAAGQQIEGEILPAADERYLPRLKRAQQQRPGGRSPEENARIMRQHSQHMALRYAALRASQGHLPKDFTLADLFKVADQFDRDAKAAKP